MNDTATGIRAELDSFLSGCHPLLDRPEGFRRDFVDQLHDLGAFRVFIPPEHGGVYRRYSESMALVSTAAYHSLELSLMLGITSSLFLMPVARYAPAETRGRVLADFLDRRLLAGMMMTEPEYGTNIMGIQTNFRPEGAGYHLQGAKHWAGLSGVGEYWLVSARKARDTGALGRDVDFFIVRSDQPGFQFDHFYPAAGLTSITYGLTRFDVQVPAENKLCGPHTNIRVMYDILNRSRISIASIAAGATRRLDVKGLFIAIGHSPATKFLQGAGIEFDEKGYVALKTRSSFTNIPGVFAAGDVADQVYRQAISAAGMGCQAAIDCERWLAEQGIH